MNISAAWPIDNLNETEVSCFAAEQQSKGQGQANNVWASPPGNIYATLLIKLSESDLPGLSLLISLTVCQLLEKYSLPNVRIKWINDVYVNDKKISGNLVRTSNIDADFFAVQMGVGVNVCCAPL
jgi:BirA family biotin operon repressor/biotin-[acetyl-CoA-carboxylase] ligase